MPLKPVFEKAPLTVMSSLPLSAGFVRMDHAVLIRLYGMVRNANTPAMLEGAFRLACIVTGRPLEEPVTAVIRQYLQLQREDGSFALSFKDSIAVLRGAWALYEYEARKPQLESIARWCAFAAQNWDALMADDDVWTSPADLMELLENFYRVTGKAAVLNLCERVATQTMLWSGVLNTVSAQRPTSKTLTREELLRGLEKEQGDRDGYYTHFYRTNHPELLADGARTAFAKGLYTGSATELNAARNGWERLYRHHGAVCGGLTSDELLEGAAPNAAVSTAAVGAWAEALCVTAMSEHSAWAWEALERMVFNAMPAVVGEDEVAPFQYVNTLGGEAPCLHVQEDHVQRALTRLTRGYAAVASSAVTVYENGAAVNLYLPGRYAVMVDEEPVTLTVAAADKGVRITVHCRKEVKAELRLRIPSWSRSTEIAVNNAETTAESRNNYLDIERQWHDGDVVSIVMEPAAQVLTGHHQGRYVLRGAVLMALPASEDAWKKAFVSLAVEGGKVSAALDEVEAWKVKDRLPADIPVLPAVKGDPALYQLQPYAKTNARIALFPGRPEA